MTPRKSVVLLLSTGFVTILAVLVLRGGWVHASALTGPQAQDPAVQSAQDTDGDGLPDAWETAHGLNPRSANGVNGAAGDPDHDGLSNGDEFANGTDPQNPDTDGDGLPDLWEVENVVDPLSAVDAAGPNGDPDGDGLLNRDEMARGTDPQNWDSDGDGMPDGYEVVQGISPHDNRGNNGANGRRNGNRNGKNETNLAEFERLNDDFSPPVRGPRGRR